MKKIMFIDDDEIHLAIAENALKDTYEIITAESGREALDKIIQGFFPDLIFLDIVMPNMDGWETYNRIRAISLLDSIPIVFLTSVQDDSVKELALEKGAVDYIVKPFERKEIINRIELILSRPDNKPNINAMGLRKSA